MNKPTIEVITCPSGDWQVLKVDLDVVYEGHSIPTCEWIKLLKSLSYKVDELEICDEDMEMGNY